jgi:tetratricopeptide (TPR) repeat protein
MKGQILFELEKVVDAKMIFEEVLAKRADDSMALVSLLICYKALWLKEKNKVNTEISPRTTRTTPYKSMILATVELLDKQLESENDAMCSEVCFRLGMFYLNFPKKKHYKIAKAILMRAARGLHPLSTFMIGWLLEVEGRLEQAEDFYMKSIALDPMSPIQFHKLSLMAQSTFTYVKGLIKIANQQNTSKVPSKHSMRPSEKNLPVRIMLHERVAYKLQLLMTSRAASIVGPCRVYVDPLWTAKFLYSYAVCENWCSFPKKSS